MKIRSRGVFIPEGHMTLGRTQLVAFAQQISADVIGVANIERFDELPPDKHPRAIFPEARSVVVVGKRITRGALTWGRGRYQLPGLPAVWLRLAGQPVRGHDDIPHRRSSSRTTAGRRCRCRTCRPRCRRWAWPCARARPAPNVMLDFDDAAVRAGVGEIGYCGFAADAAVRAAAADPDDPH